MCCARLLYFLLITCTVYSQQQFIPFIRRIAEAEFDPIGVVLSQLLDDNGDSQQRWRRPLKSSNKETDGERWGIFDRDLDNVADKASDLLEEMFSFVAGRNGERISTKPIRAQMKTPVHNALTLGEHVCVRENKVDVPNVKGISECIEFGSATRCISGGGNFTLARIVECCKGYNTTDIRKGCRSDGDMLTLMELLPNINNCMNISAHKPHFTQATILLPSSTVCDAKEYSKNEINNNSIDGIYHSYDFLDSQRIRTQNGQYIIVEEGKSQSKLQLPLLNCIEIEDGDIIAIDGVVHVLQRPLSTSTRNILETLSIRNEFSTFMELLDEDLKELLNSEQVYTIFVFTNDAFSALSHSLQMRMRQRSQCTKDLIKEHIYRGVYCSARMQHSLEAITGKKHQISKEVVNGTLFIRVDNARVMETDMIATNGIIHIVDDVILSEKFADWRDHLAIYEEGFMKLVDEVISNNEEPTAIFLPPRESFKNLSDEKSFVLNHIIPRAEMITANYITSAYGSKIASSFEENKTSFGCIRPLKPSQRLCNTVVYFITQPLPVVKQNILDVLSTHEDLSVFLSLLHNSSLNELVDLESDGPYTLLIPSDDALSKNQIKALRRNKTMAEKFVRRHIFKGFICSSELYTTNNRFNNPKLLENLQREFYAGRLKSGYITVGDSKLEEKDALATNGIIHILESPLKVTASQAHTPLYSSLIDIFDL